MNRPWHMWAYCGVCKHVCWNGSFCGRRNASSLRSDQLPSGTGGGRSSGAQAGNGKALKTGMTGGTSGAVGNSGGQAGKLVGMQGSGMGMSDGRATVSEAAGRTTAVGDCRILAGGAAVTCVTVGMGPFCIGRKASSSGVASIPSRGEEKALLSSGSSSSSGRGGSSKVGTWAGGLKSWATGQGGTLSVGL